MIPDVNNLNYYYFNKESNLLYDKDKYKINFFVVFKQFFEIFVKGIGALKYFFDLGYYGFCTQSDFALFGFTNNNIRSLSPLKEHLPSSNIFSDHNIKFKKVWFYAMLYSPVILYRCLVYKSYKKETYCFNFKGFCRSYGMYKEASKMLKIINPKFVIVSNYQSYTSRSFYKAAKELGIKTVFLQHATAVECDPQLDFDYAFLDGIEAYEKLTARKKSLSKIFLSGNPRFDFFPVISNVKEDFILGIAINILDDEKFVKNFILECKNEIPELQIVLRPHPTTNLQYWKKKCEDWGCLFSNSSTENPFEFITRCSFFIAGDSSFHLDVAIADKLSFYYNFTSQKSLDLYSYIKNNLIIDISYDAFKYLKTIKKEDEKYKNSRTKYYVANYETQFWQKSAYLIAKTLIKIDREEDFCNFWCKKENFYVIKK